MTYDPQMKELLRGKANIKCYILVPERKGDLTSPHWNTKVFNDKLTLMMMPTHLLSSNLVIFRGTRLWALLMPYVPVVTRRSACT
jgi:hypothetical protein